ncbi:MAG TPA: hypothetical protein VHI71_06815 [Actinomycetota bacterium]|nr:hypothetical protein [Actinomycetota bacterium]
MTKAAVIGLIALFSVGACNPTTGGGDVIPYAELPVPEDASDEELIVTRDQVALVMSFLDVPAKVTLGSDIRYVVELRNVSDETVSLEPCPVYYQAWGESGFSVSRTSYLNCRDAPAEIVPGNRVRFEMRLPVDDEEAVHVDGGLVWYLGHPGAEGEYRMDVQGAEGPKIVRPRS